MKRFIKKKVLVKDLEDKLNIKNINFMYKALDTIYVQSNREEIEMTHKEFIKLTGIKEHFKLKIEWKDYGFLWFNHKAIYFIEFSREQ